MGLRMIPPCSRGTRITVCHVYVVRAGAVVREVLRAN